MSDEKYSRIVEGTDTVGGLILMGDVIAAMRADVDKKTELADSCSDEPTTRPEDSVRSTGKEGQPVRLIFPKNATAKEISQSIGVIREAHGFNKPKDGE